MNPLLQHFFQQKVKNKHQKSRSSGLTKEEIEKKAREYVVGLKHGVIDVGFLLLGVFSAAFGLKGFLLPSEFIDGGVMGISLILFQLTNVSLPLLVFLINLPFILLAIKAVSLRFALRSILGISLLALVLHFVHFPVVTEDKILVSAFGGIFLGLGIGMAIRGGAILDGTEVLAIFVSRRTNATVGNIILLFNIIIFGVSAYVLSVEIALYAILTYFIASKTIDFVIDGVEEYIAVTIISDHSDSIRRAIINNMRHGCTLLNGKKGLSKTGDELQDTQLVYTIITRLEIAKLKTEVDKIDAKAFIVMTSVKDTKGGMVKKKPISMIK